MDIQWLGTAGFKISTHGVEFLIDPYLSRNKKASPVQNLKPSDIKKASHIFLSHGHFDHVMDVPTIVENTKAKVFCSEMEGDQLSWREDYNKRREQYERRRKGGAQ